MTDSRKNEGRPANDPGRITLDVEDIRGMTAGEMAQYAREHPEEWRQMVPELMETITNMHGKLLETAEPLQEAATLATEEIIRRRADEIVTGILRLMEMITAGGGAAEQLDTFYTEIDVLRPFIGSIMDNDPATKEKEFEDLLEPLPPGAVFNIINEVGTDGLKIEEVPELTADEQAIVDKIAEIIRQARAAKSQKKKRKKGEYIDPLGLKTADYLPLLNGNLTNGLMRLTARDFTPNEKGTTAYYTGPDGHVYTIEQYNKLLGSLETSTKKIFDAAILYLTGQNHNRGTKNINPTVLIPLTDYGEKNGYQLTPRTMDTKEEQEKENNRVRERIKEFRRRCKRDLSDIEKITYTAEEATGRNAGNYVKMRIISSHGISNGVIKINFDIDAARYLVNGGPMYFPLILFAIDNRKPNTYSIGRKLALHNSIDNNYWQGTNNTLSIKKLLNQLSDLPTKQELDDTGQRNWKRRIKKPLENALNDLIDPYPYIKKWEYRHPKTGQIYTEETAQALTWEVYSSLVIDWTVRETPQEQIERRARIAEKKAATGQPEKKKRGRPRKRAVK